MTKAELRKWVRQELKTHSADELQQLSEATCRLILEHPRVQEAETVLAFWPLPDEVDIRPAVRELYNQGKTILLPHVISDTEMEICQYEGDESLTEGAYGLYEPHVKWKVESGKWKVESGDYQCSLSSKLSTLTVGETINNEQLTINNYDYHCGVVVLVPGRAFDRVGHRLGRGKGYYDRFLSRFTDDIHPSSFTLHPSSTIGISYPFQIVDSVPSDEHDILIKEHIWRTSK